MWNGSDRWAYINAFAPTSEEQMIVLLSREVGHASVPSFMEAELNPDAFDSYFNHWNVWRERWRQMFQIDIISKADFSFYGNTPLIHTHIYSPSSCFLPPLNPYNCRANWESPSFSQNTDMWLGFLLGDPGICVGLNPTGERGMWRQVSHILWSALIHDLVVETVCLWNSPAPPLEGLFCVKSSPVLWEHLPTWLVPVRWMEKSSFWNLMGLDESAVKT